MPALAKKGKKKKRKVENIRGVQEILQRGVHEETKKEGRGPWNRV